MTTDHGDSSEAEVLGLTTEEAPSGRHTPTEDLCSAALATQFEGGGGGRRGPASEASVRAEGPRALRGERARVGASGGRYRSAASPVSLAAKSHEALVSNEKSCAVPNSIDRASVGLPTPTPKTTQALACRVDALVIAFKINLTPAIDTKLNERQALANTAGAAEVNLKEARFAIKRSRNLDYFVLENGDVRLTVDRCGRGGWNAEVTVRAIHLATHLLGEAIALARRLTASLGVVPEARLRRFDLAADFVGFSLSPGDIERLRTTRAKAERFVVQDKDVADVGTPLGRAMREYRDSSLRVTGFAVSSGNPVMARIYDKRVEVRLPGRESKRAIEEARWLDRGWDGRESVVRVEFQHRGAFLDEIKLRDPARMEDAIDAVWQRDVRWLSIIDPTSATRRCRCALDARWEAVAATIFTHTASPIERNREFRGGAKPEHVLGNAVSRLASTGRLDQLGFDATEYGEVLDEESVGRMSEADARAWVRRTLGAIVAALPEDLARHVLSRGEPRQAALTLFSKLRAASARFSSSDDAGEAR